MKRILVDASVPPFMSDLLEGLTLYVAERRAPWQLYYASQDEFIPALKHRPDGLLTFFARDEVERIADMRRARIPVVNMVRNLHPQVPSVASDHRAIGAAAAEYFLSRGFQNYAFLGTDREWSDARFAGFAARLRESGHTPVQLDIPLHNDRFRHVATPRLLKALQKWLRTLTCPLALFAASDYIARPGLDACVGLKLAVPEQVSILGVDNDRAICELGSVPLSSIPQNFLRIGFEAARLLDGLMSRRRRPRAPLWIPPRDVVIRRSTNFFAAADPHVAAALRVIHTPGSDFPTLKKILHHIPVSRQYLDLQFKHTIGRTPSEEIRRVKLALAKSLLLSTHLTVHEIALRCGFSYAENLTRFLHDQLGLSARQLRGKDRLDP